MCISKNELNEKIKEIRSLKALLTETEENIKALEFEVISFLQETEGCKTTDKKGKAIFQYIGTDYKATYAEQTRTTLDKAKLTEILGEDLKPFEKVTSYSVLRIK